MNAALWGQVNQAVGVYQSVCLSTTVLLCGVAALVGAVAVLVAATNQRCERGRIEE